MADPTVLDIFTVLAPFAAVTAGDATFTFAPGTETDGDVYTCTGRELLLVYNSDSVDPYTITIASEDDEWNRSENITSYSLAAGEYAVFGVGLTNSQGWKNADGQIRITVNNAAVLVAVLKLPGGYPGS